MRLRLRGAQDTPDGRRWCKKCKAYIQIELFKRQHGKRKYHLCKKHAKMRWGEQVLRAKERAVSFCRKTLAGLRSHLTFKDVVDILDTLNTEERESVRIVPRDRSAPLSKENYALVSPKIKRVLGKTRSEEEYTDVIDSFSILQEVQSPGDAASSPNAGKVGRQQGAQDPAQKQEAQSPQRTHEEATPL